MSQIYLIDARSHVPYLVEQSAVIGREPSCDLHWTSSSLAPKHLKISFKNENFFVESLENKSPVSLNGIKILAAQKYLVKRGDTLEFAGRRFILSLTDELPEKTVTKIRDDVFGLSGNSDLDFGELQLECEVEMKRETKDFKELKEFDGERAPRDEMKKSRRIIVEIQQTKKQLNAKLQERKTLRNEKNYVDDEIQRIQKLLEQAPICDQTEFLSQREAELTELEAVENKVNELKKSLSKLISQRDDIKTRLQAESRFVDFFENEKKLIQRQFEVDKELTTLESLDLEDKIHKLDECLKEEQENYQRLHDFKALNSSQKKREG